MCAAKVAKWMLAISCTAALLSCRPTLDSTNAAAIYALTDSIAATAVAKNLTAIDDNLTVEIDEWHFTTPCHDSAASIPATTTIVYRHATAKRNNSLTSTTTDSTTAVRKENGSHETSTDKKVQRQPPLGNLPTWLTATIILIAIIYITIKIIPKK